MLISDFKNWVSLVQKNNAKYCKERDRLNKIERLNNKYIIAKDDSAGFGVFIFITILILIILGFMNKALFLFAGFLVVLVVFYALLRSVLFLFRQYFTFKLYLLRNKKNKLESVFNVFENKEDLYLKILGNLNIFENKDLSHVERALSLMKTAKETEHKKKQIEIENAISIAKQKELDDIKSEKEKLLLAAKKAKEEALRNKRILKIQKEHDFVNED